MKMTSEPGVAMDVEQCRVRKNSKETIHSGHFMVSDFEAEDQDEEGVEVPDPTENEADTEEEIQGVRGINQGGVITYAKPTSNRVDQTTVSIDASLTKLFQTMTLAYRQNITSPKWNCFKGLRLRWKDKIRLNNVIWRCWHMQYIQKKQMTVCQFALDVDLHNRPEAVVLEGKYWKRRMKAVTAEYRKWRLFYKNSLTGVELMLPDQGDMLSPLDKSANNYKSFLGLEEMEWAGSFFNKQGFSLEGSLMDGFDLTDMLFSPFNTSPQLFPFPNPREIARGTGNSDLLQPGLVQLQPDLADDYMMDINEMLTGRGLSTVPEEDFFPDVEDTAALPPSSSPPSISTPTPSTQEFTRLSAHSAYSLNEPPSPALFSPHDTFIPSRRASTPSSTPNPAHTPLSSPNTPPQNPTHFSPPPPAHGGSLRQQSHAPKPFTRSRSATELQHQSFAVPKSLPKKKYYGKTISYEPAQVAACTPCTPTTESTIMGPTTIVFPTSISSQDIHVMATLASDRPVGGALSSAAVEAPMGSAPPMPLKMEFQSGSFSSSSDSALFAHLLHSENYASTLVGAQPTSQHTNKIRATRITPRPYPEVAATSANNCRSNSCNSNSSSSSSLSSLISSSSSSVSSLKSESSGSGSAHPQAHLLPNVTLSAVTPSSIKCIQANPSIQVSSWASTGKAALALKGSPPYPESTSPTRVQTGGSVSPPTKAFRPKNDVERVQYREHRRVCHIKAEQNRRCNIKYNFDMLHSLIPSVNNNPNAKVSKATMLNKAGEYIQQMKQERQHLADEAENYRRKIETLSAEISLAQSLLPATGAPVSHSRHNKIKEKFDTFVRDRTLANPKYYILSLIAQPLLDSFNSSVSTASVDDLCRSSLTWLDQHCSLNILRPVVSSAMRKLSTSTNILNSPDLICEDIVRQVTKQESTQPISYSSIQYSTSDPSTSSTSPSSR